MDEFPELFRIYALRSARFALKTIDPNDHILPDDVRVRALHVLSFALKVNEAWPYVRELLMLLSPKMEQAGFRDEWMIYLENAVSQSQHCADRLAEAELHLRIGELHRLRSRFALAHLWLTESVAIFEALEEWKGKARALNQLAYLAWQQHKYEETKQLTGTAIQLLNDDDPEQATSFTLFGLIAIDRQHWQEAEGYHRAALRIHTIHGDQRKIAWSLQNLGITLRGQGNYVEAIDCHERAITILEEVKDSANCAIGQMNLGALYWLCGEQVRALRLYKLAESTFQRIGDVWSLARVLLHQGFNYLALRDWKQAESKLLASFNLYQTLGDRSESLHALNGLGTSYLEQGFYDKALAIFEGINEQLAQIVDTPAYYFLAPQIASQLAQAQAGQNNTKIVEDITD